MKRFEFGFRILRMALFTVLKESSAPEETVSQRAFQIPPVSLGMDLGVPLVGVMTGGAGQIALIRRLSGTGIEEGEEIRPALGLD